MRNNVLFFLFFILAVCSGAQESLVLNDHVDFRGSQLPGSINQLSLSEENPHAQSKKIDLGGGVALEIVQVPPGEFTMGSTLEEKIWATGWDGGAQPGTGVRESYEGEPHLVRVKDEFWIGRTEVTVGQFKRFVEETGYITDAEKDGGVSEVYDPEWEYNAYEFKNPWRPTKGKSWRDPNFGFPLRDDYPVVCVSYNDDKAFCEWLTKHERNAGRLPEGLVYRLPTEAEWEYACRGGKEGTYFWWGNDINEGKGRLNISGMDFIPGRDIALPYVTHGKRYTTS